MLNCPNVRCQAVNNLDSKFCLTCGTPLARRYLWMLETTMAAQRIGETIASRYLVVQPRLLLDTQPAVPPETPEDFPSEIAHYLRLFAHRLHIPQVYGTVMDTAPIWLLEGVPMINDALRGGKFDSRGDSPGEMLRERLAPELTTVWAEASPLRQLSWLRQIANLWHPLHSQGVSASLLNPELVRVSGSLVRLLELQNASPTLGLIDLGHHWLTLVQPQSPIALFLEELATQLSRGQIVESRHVVAILDAGIREYGNYVQHSYQVVTDTNKGPSREGNEDACYPPPGVIAPLGKNLLAIVCDGIGGHDGGEVASELAITTIQAQVAEISSRAGYESPELEQKLEAAIRGANDVISDRNDLEQRHNRQRMGTTVVMAWSYAQDIYISHVGDSRAYWITPTGCYQFTLDDDIATREVCLGYTLYRETLKYPSSGSLVQALGMTSSTNLYPTVQRLTLDESGIFLLCSDGLSDYDRVEQNWEALILPILRGESDLAAVVPKLIDLANTQNGHDNVTVALIYCQVTVTAPTTPLKFPSITVPPPVSSPTSTFVPPPSAKSSPPTPALSQQKTLELPVQRHHSFLWGILIILGVGGVGVWGAIQTGLINLEAIAPAGETPPLTNLPPLPTVTINPTPNPSFSPSLNPTPSPSNNSPNSPATPPLLGLQVGDRLKLNSSLFLPLANKSSQKFTLPANTILQVVKQTAAPNQADRLELAVCSIPNTIREIPNTGNLPPGNVVIDAQSLGKVIDPQYPRRSTTGTSKCSIGIN